ncbi:TonB-dependent receptor [Erythrobacter rubeus]|uniref:TonB-dependent receptor n=1 Tax=Erythrobacter rubeus TaxID=2760803 RepID=A0ABR8KX41_9SPHN|nr:TonB-dependent receptor [Erythrobacter rubeus]MBD2842771.1 TonB-dependent receptor [Erythrobacter rubeus]
MIHRLSRAALLLGCATFAFPAAAETTDSAADSVDYGDREIEVRGDVLYSDQLNSVKTPTPVIDVPQSVSIVTQEQIIQQGFDSIADIVLYTPGVTNSQGEGHRDAVVFRGVRSTADFFVDGVRDDVQYYRSLYNLEQVEILRGPNALLFGRGGTGGVLNRVTKKGAIGQQFVGYLGSVDTFGAFTGQIDVNFATSESTALRINAAYEDLNNQRDFFDGERIGINPTFRAELGPATIIDLSYEFIDHERFIDRGIPATEAGLPAEQFDRITFGDPIDNFTTLEAHVFRGTIQHAFSESFKGNFTASYGDYDKVYSNLFPVGFDETANEVALDGYIDTTQRENLILTANLIGEFETGSIGHTILFGGEFIDTVNNNDRFNSFFDQTQDDVEFFTPVRPLAIRGGVGVNSSGETTVNTFSQLNDDTEADVTVFSLYIQDEIELTDWLNVVLGARFDSFDITVDNIETFIDTGVRDIATRVDEEISPRVGVILKPQENISIYGSYSESFLPRSGEQFADINPPDDALDPDTFENLELGLKWDILDALSFTAAIFRIEQSSPQVADDDPGTLDIIDSEIEGVELQLQGNITDRWFFTAGYSYLDGNQVDAFGVEGNRVRELPEHMLSLWSTYQVTDRFGLGGGFTFQDESFADNANTVTLPDYIRFDAAAYYDVSDRVRLQVNIENLFDEDYFPNAHIADNITVGAPLNARFTVTGRF